MSMPRNLGLKPEYLGTTYVQNLYYIDSLTGMPNSQTTIPNFQVQAMELPKVGDTNVRWRVRTDATNSLVFEYSIDGGTSWTPKMKHEANLKTTLVMMS